VKRLVPFLLVLSQMPLPGHAAAQAAAPAPARVVPIQVTGEPASRFSLVILSDGYTAAEMDRYRAHVDKHLNVMWSLEPFRSYRNYINVYSVEIESPESGITCDPAHREVRTTPLGTEFGGGCDNPNARGIRVRNEDARLYAAMATPDFDQILTIANTDTYGGIGGSTATTSGGNALGPYITPHELGHSLGRLQDEYTYSARGVMGGVWDRDEPTSVQHTLLTESGMRAQQAKWWRWLGEESESGGIIGRFEGGQSHVAGIWRPSRHSMMISLGYYFDQVSLERMTDRISDQVELIAAASPATSAVPPDAILWIDTAHPVYHELDITWQVDGRVVNDAAGRHHLDLRALSLGPGEHTVAVTAVDPTPFVRDPAIRDSALTATRSWTVRADAAPAAGPGAIAFTGSTDTGRPVGGRDIVFVETTHSPDRVPAVQWRIDGRALDAGTNPRTLDLAALGLARGTQQLTATLTDPVTGDVSTEALSWVVDNTPPTVTHTVADPQTVVTRPDGAPHYFIRDRFTMRLDPADDQPGYVVAEFRVNGDGWHHYYGWPDAPPGTPFLFTPRGTTIKELVYGSLSAEGLSPQPWEERAPGWGTHAIESRARDAAGNIGDAETFYVTFQPLPDCTTTITADHAGELNVAAGVTCLVNATVAGPVTVREGASLVANGATIRGAFDATGASAIEVVGSNVEGEVRIAGTTGTLTLFGSTFARGVLLEQTTAASAIVAGNRIAGRVECDANTSQPAHLGASNDIGGGTSACIRP
jgi:hypothetical protein